MPRTPNGIRVLFAATFALLLCGALPALWSEDEKTLTRLFTANNQADDESKRPSISEARNQARILHTAIDSTLRVTHDRYYREDEGLIIPASALKEVFADLESKEKINLRWLAVEGLAMNTDHVASTDFEKAAVEALKSGKTSHEQVSDDLLRVAMPIALTNHCLKCHMPNRKSTEDRTAGLIISLKVRPE